MTPLSSRSRSTRSEALRLSVHSSLFALLLLPTSLVAVVQRVFADEPLPSLDEIRSAYVQSLTALPAFEATMVVHAHPSKAADPNRVLTDFTIRVIRDGDRILKDVHA